MPPALITFTTDGGAPGDTSTPYSSPLVLSATTVVRADESLEILAVNKLDEYTLASPAAVGGQIFIRTMEYVYCIE